MPRDYFVQGFLWQDPGKDLSFLPSMREKRTTADSSQTFGDGSENTVCRRGPLYRYILSYQRTDSHHS